MTEAATASESKNSQTQPSNTIEQPAKYTEELITLRRARIIELLGKGRNQNEIAKELGVDKGTVSRDIKELRLSAKERIKGYVEETIPFEHEKLLAGLSEIIREAWAVYESDSDNRTKLQALSVAQSAINSRLQALGDPEQITRALRLVASLRAKVTEHKNNGNDNGTGSEDLDNATVASEAKN